MTAGSRAGSSTTYCDVSLPVPLDRFFTYRLPATLVHRVQPGARLVVPFGRKKLVGFALRIHASPPPVEAKPALQLLDEEPVLDPTLLKLGEWIADYYCAPLGEVLRGMAPLAGETRRSKVYSLTRPGRDLSRQLSLDADESDVAMQLLRQLEKRPLSAGSLVRKIPNAQRMLDKLERKGLVAVADSVERRDPLRASSDRLRIQLAGQRPDGKFVKAERELLAYLELFPGSHNLKELEEKVKGASGAARNLARRKIVDFEMETASPVTFLPRTAHELNPHQKAAYDAIVSSMSSRQFSVFLMQGVTGSGKTEVYLKAIEKALESSLGALMLVPEIALTPAVAAQFHHRFGEKVAILHSAFSETERAEQWRRIRSGEAQVVVGTRSGVFAPVRNLGLVVIDEEHDHSYKQEETPRYNGRDVAIVRARNCGAVVVLGSATPALESRHNVEKGKYRLLLLPERVEQRPLPSVKLVDMREEFLDTRKQTTFSRELLDSIARRLDSREQTMILLNRRGFASFVTCRACGHRIECINCSVTLTFHRRDRRLLCHYCSYAERVPEVCPKCESEYLYFAGTGSEKVEDQLRLHFPEARIARLDRDTVGGKREYEQILQGFREGAFDILVGTQMIAKGHDIPRVTLVGVVNADIGLGLPDFRAAERTFQLLTQVAGRSGRGELPGLVLIQTLNPDHYSVKLAATQDYDAFYRRELHFRHHLRYPPFAALANVLVRDPEHSKAHRMGGELQILLQKIPEGVKVLGPAEAPVPRLKRDYRYQLLVKAGNRALLREVLQKIRMHGENQKWNAGALVIDVDPLSLL